MTHNYTFRTYIVNGREYYEYRVDVLTWTERSELEKRGQPTIIKRLPVSGKPFVVAVFGFGDN